MKLILGLGCDRDTSMQTIEIAVEQALASVGRTCNEVIAAASIDKKSDEVGLLALCQKKAWPISFYPADLLAEIDVPNPSDVVLKYVGTPSVGEAAAILCADATKEDLLVEKYKYKGADGKHATVSVVSVNHA